MSRARQNLDSKSDHMTRVRPDQAQVAEVAGGGECCEVGLTYGGVEKSAPPLRSQHSTRNWAT